jgi:ubiquinone/menaquinone biosynthesis C-methylase UbiE
MADSTRKRDKAKKSIELAHQQLLQAGTFDHYEDTALYDFEYQDQRADIDWYLALASESAAAKTTGARQRGREFEILELGAGTGRITLPLVQTGLRVQALDLNEKMLAALRHKAEQARLATPACVVADMRELPLADHSVDLVIAPFNALMHLYTHRDLSACFREVHRVLRPGGEFAFDVLLPDLDWLTWDPNARHGVTKFRHPVTNERMVYSTNHEYDHNTQICHIRLYYDLGSRVRPRSEPHKLVHLAHRQIYPEEIRAHLELAGLELVSLDGDFLGLSLRGEIESQVVRARKPS